MPRAHSPRLLLVPVLLALLSLVDTSAPATTPHTPAAVAREAGADAGWWEAACEKIVHEEYNATQSRDGWQAPNRATGLRTYFHSEGIEIVPRLTSDPAWTFGWETTRFGRPGALRAVPAASPEAEGARVTYQRNAFEEWYENKPEGIEQGFTVPSRPPGEGSLWIVGRIGGVHAEQSGEESSVDLFDAAGSHVLRYEKLLVLDATGAEVPARLHLEGEELAIVVDDRQARYPLVVDPLMTTPAWSGDGQRGEAWFGFSVATAGDVNGDGYSDVIVGAPYFDFGQRGGGRVFVYHGSPTGLATSAAWTMEANQDADRFGASVATAGDVNGDGYSDVIIGAPTYDGGLVDEGKAFVYQGSASGLSLTPAWTAEGNQTSAHFGFSVGTAGDVNADGFSDVIVGAPDYDNGQSNEGRAYVFHGSPTGLSPTSAWSSESNQADAHYGTSVAWAGDVNGDGVSDVIVGGPDHDAGLNLEGRVWVYHGSAGTGLFIANWFLNGGVQGARFGASVATAGDVNGDGYSDVIIGAPDYTSGQTGEGRALVYLGSGGGLTGVTNWVVESGVTGARFGHSVSTVGDVNGDGYADVVVGAPDAAGGKASVYLGSSSGVAQTAAWNVLGSQTGAQYGVSVSTAGDVNGDGISDLVVGAPFYDNPANSLSTEGAAFLYLGSQGSLQAATAMETTGQSGAEHGFSVSTAGDVNGDGYSDVIVGARNYDNGQNDEGRVWVFHGSGAGLDSVPDWTAESNQPTAHFGAAVSTAGDVNGDGYSDVIVGAPDYDSGQLDEGRVFVFLGSASGLVTPHAWSADGNQMFAHFGASVSTAGDVDGNGYSDVIIGAPDYDGSASDGGAAFVYLSTGSAAGLAANPSWTVNGSWSEGHYGYSVSTAGDVNGDGCSDVIVGQPNYNLYYGRVFVYHGSVTGLSTSANWTKTSDVIDTALFGNSVSTAGDVNRDGYSDVIIGAPERGAEQGAAFVFYGSPTGLEGPGAPPVWITTGVTSDQLGYSVSTAGDVNGDGYSDVVIGAPGWQNLIDNGRALVFHGSATGLPAAANWSRQTNQAFAQFGYSVSMAGDVNGDGYSDVIIGAPFFDSYQGALDHLGKAYVFYGNEGNNRRTWPRQQRTDAATPVAPLGRTGSETQFRIRAIMLSVFGRTGLQMESEVKPLGVPFDGLNTAQGSFTDVGADGIVNYNRLVSGLSPGTSYRWRVRPRYNLVKTPFQRCGPWVHMPVNGWGETDVRTGGIPTAVAEQSTILPAGLQLSLAGPNPGSWGSTLRLWLRTPARARADVLDPQGRVVASIFKDRALDPGPHVIAWDGRGRSGKMSPAGTYFIRVRAGDETRTQKVIQIR